MLLMTRMVGLTRGRRLVRGLAAVGPGGLSAYQFEPFRAIYDLIRVMKVSNLLSSFLVFFVRVMKIFALAALFLLIKGITVLNKI